MKPALVLKIGGSLLYDSELRLNKPFLFKLLKWYESVKGEYKQIVMVVGGGTISRHLTDQLSEIVPSDKYLHGIGMATTVVNSQILRSFLHDEDIYIPSTMGDALETILGEDAKVVITGGYKEGWSTDMDAAVFADITGSKKFYKLSNIDYIYTGDPATTPDARPIPEMTWKDFMTQFEITPGVSSHKPGAHTPIGTFAAQFCMNKGIEVVLGGGSNLDGEGTILEAFEKGSVVRS